MACPKLSMCQTSQCIFLDCLDQDQTEFEISSIHQVYSYCNVAYTASAFSFHLWTDSAEEGCYMKYTNNMFWFCMIF